MRLPRPAASLAPDTRLVLTNHRRWTGEHLVAGGDEVEALFFAPRVVLAAAGTFGGDHVFTYANQAALDLFESAWEELIGLPSSQSAEPGHRDERRKLLDEVGRHGFIRNYSGVRVSRTGRRFRILRATVFNLLGEDGAYLGQAATFTEWEPLPSASTPS